MAKYSTNDSRNTAFYKNCSTNDISYNDITRCLGSAQTESIIGRGSWVCSFQGEDGDEDDDDVDEGVEDGEDVDEDDEEHDEDAKEHDEDVDEDVDENVEDGDEGVEQGGLRTGKGGWFKNSF